MQSYGVLSIYLNINYNIISFEMLILIIFRDPCEIYTTEPSLSSTIQFYISCRILCLKYSLKKKKRNDILREILRTSVLSWAPNDWINKFSLGETESQVPFK